MEYREGGQTFVKNRVGCPEKAAREIGFTARTGLDEGLRQLIAWRNAHKEAVLRRRQKAL